MTVPFSYVRPVSLQDAMNQLADKTARIHAGGTDLLGCLRDGVFHASKVVSISRLSNLHGMRKRADGGLTIGALTTLAEVASYPAVMEKYTALAQAAAAVASPQIRNQGTLGGNLCQKPRCWYYRGEFHCLRKGGDYCYAAAGENQYHCILGGKNCFIVHPSDTAAALVALDASLRIAGPRGSRIIPVEDFYVLPEKDVTKETILEPEEIVTEILLPPVSILSRSSYRKVRTRQAWDFALAGVALVLEHAEERVKQSRVVLSGAAPAPWRVRAVEKIINGSSLEDDIIKKAAWAAVSDARPLSKNGYKVPLFRGMLEEELEKTKNRM